MIIPILQINTADQPRVHLCSVDLGLPYTHLSPSSLKPFLTLPIQRYLGPLENQETWSCDINGSGERILPPQANTQLLEGRCGPPSFFVLPRSL